MFKNVLKNGSMAVLVSAIVLGTSMPAFAATSAENTEAIHSGANEVCMKLCSDLSYDAINANVDVRTAVLESNTTTAHDAMNEEARAIDEKRAAMKAAAAFDSDTEVIYEIAEPVAAADNSVNTGDSRTSMSANSVRFLNSEVSFIYDEACYSAPANGAALWMGTSDNYDGDMCFLVGHNPGDFSEVMKLSDGDTVVLCDAAGTECSYTVSDVWVMSNDSYFEDICDGLYAHGECVILQTCIGNGDVRMVIADAS